MGENHETFVKIFVCLCLQDLGTNMQNKLYTRCSYEKGIIKKAAIYLKSSRENRNYILMDGRTDNRMYRVASLLKKNKKASASN